MRGKGLFWILFLLGTSVTATGLYWVGDAFVRILFRGERSYIASSPSMIPTFQVGERFLRKPVNATELQRGDLITFKVATDGKEMMHLKRVAGLEGDTIQLIDGTVVINGNSANQKEIGKETGIGMTGEVEYLRLREQFPGEKESHEIYDERYSSGDNFGPVVVPENHIFVLGDNRDNSADSRSPPYMPISGMISVGNVTGRVTKIWWSSDSSRIGRSIH